MFFFLVTGFFGWEITEGRSIYRWQSFGTTADMFREYFCFRAAASRPRPVAWTS
jgi:hypothetical protein